jgi:hypothetical protein
VLRWLRAYTASDNPRISACNTIAMVIAWNQPYYPLYLWWIVGRDAWVGIPDAFSGILFFAVPAIARRSGMLGRVAMVILSVANVVFCSMMLAMTGLPLVAWLLTRGRLDIPLVRFPPEAYASLFTLNAVSAGSLMVFFGWLLAGISRSDAERQCSHR